MQIIKNKQIIDDSWVFVADDQALTDGNICVSLARWQQDKDALLNRDGKVGVRLATSDGLAAIADKLGQICLIELDFPAFTDGRGFSQARLLREQYGYNGEIRAVGNYMLDQVGYLTRVGVDAFELADENQLPLALSLMNEVSVAYQ